MPDDEFKISSDYECDNCNRWFSHVKKFCPYCNAKNEDWKPVASADRNPDLYLPRVRNPMIVEREKKALALRKAGKSYKEIGEILGIATKQQVYQILRKATEMILSDLTKTIPPELLNQHNSNE